VSLTAWRITKRKHTKTAFNGTGARNCGGRWNNPGTAVVYTAETQSLAVLEMLVHLDGPELLQRYVLIGVQIDESLVHDLHRPTLPRNWQADPPPAGLRKFGDEWVIAGSSVALRVPSALVPAENNLLLNPTHPDFQKLVIEQPTTFSFDPRLAL